MVEDIDVQLALLDQSSKSQVAAAHESDAGIVWIGAVNQVKLGVQRVPQEKLNDDFPCLQLRAETPKTRFVVDCWERQSSVAPGIPAQRSF